MTSQSGTYALVLACGATHTVRIGKLGELQVQPGYYLYVGSAFGTGGLAARLRHHERIAARTHWHIDYLRAVCDLIEVWFTTDPRPREHIWARAVAHLPGAGVPMPSFGSSDCECAAHLFQFTLLPSLRVFRQRTHAASPACGPIASWKPRLRSFILDGSPRFIDSTAR
jgi:Uri superfamily endonuclease